MKKLTVPLFMGLVMSLWLISTHPSKGGSSKEETAPKSYRVSPGLLTPQPTGGKFRF